MKIFLPILVFLSLTTSIFASELTLIVKGQDEIFKRTKFISIGIKYANGGVSIPWFTGKELQSGYTKKEHPRRYKEAIVDCSFSWGLALEPKDVRSKEFTDGIEGKCKHDPRTGEILIESIYTHTYFTASWHPSKFEKLNADFLYYELHINRYDNKQTFEPYKGRISAEDAPFEIFFDLISIRRPYFAIDSRYITSEGTGIREYADTVKTVHSFY